MKKLLWVVIPLLLLLSTCNVVKSPVKEKYGTLVLTLSISEMAAKTIVPFLDTNIAYYTVNGDGPGTAAFSHGGVTTTTVVETSVAVGTWTITVDAFNAKHDLIGSGSTDAFIEAGQATQAVIDVTPLEGTGTFTIHISWPSGTISNPSLSATLTAAGGGSQALLFTVRTTSASYSSGQILNAGYYSLTLQLFDGGVVKWGCFEAVRILMDRTTTGVFNLTAGDLNTNGANLTITPNMQDPITVTLDGPPHIPSGEDGTFTASTSVAVDTYQWYLNGGLLTGEINPSITIGSGLRYGTYRLDLRVTKGNVISSGSHKFSIAALAITSFSFPSVGAGGTIDENAKTIAVTVPFGTDVTTLVATFTSTGQSVRVGSTLQVSGVTANDFSSPVTYTVTATDGSTANYTVTVSVLDPSGSIVVLSSVSLEPATVTGGNGATGSVTLSNPAPAGGALVTLSSNSAVATVPASVMVAAGAVNQLFAASTNAVTALTTATIFATYSGVTKSTVLSVAPVDSAQPLVWDLAGDFRPSPNAQNPSPDAYGNPNVWHYMTNAAATFDRDGNYTLLTTFKTGELGMWPVNTPFFQEWKIFGDTPWVGKNTSESTLDLFFQIPVPAGAALLHPNYDRNVVIGWRSPIEGEVSVEGKIESINFCGGSTEEGGVTWNIDKNSGPSNPGSIASGAIDALSYQDFLSGEGGDSLRRVSVKVGDMIYLVVGPRSNYACDWTLVDLSIKSNFVTVQPAPVIYDFHFVSPASAQVAIDHNAKTIGVTVPNGTDITSLVANFATTRSSSVTVGSALQVSGVTANDFSSPVVYTLTAFDGSTATYTVTVSVMTESGEKAITLFSMVIYYYDPYLEWDGVWYGDGTIDENAKTIVVWLGPFLAEMYIIEQEVSLETTGASVTIDSTEYQANGGVVNIPQASSGIYTVTAHDGSTADYMVWWQY
jgi:hypothetical protein